MAQSTSSVLVVFLCLAILIFLVLSGLTWYLLFQLPADRTAHPHIVPPSSVVPVNPITVTPASFTRIGLTVTASNPAMTEALVSLQAVVTALQRMSCEVVSSVSPSLFATQTCSGLKAVILQYLTDMFAVIGPKFASDLGKLLDVVVPDACTNNKPDLEKIRRRFNKTFCSHFDGGSTAPKIGFAFVQDPAGFTPEVLNAAQTLLDDGQQYACGELMGVQMTSDDSHTSCPDNTPLDVTTFTKVEQELLLKYKIPALLHVFTSDLLTAFGCQATNSTDQTFDASNAQKMVVASFCQSS